LQSLLVQEDDGLERMKKNGPQDVCYASLFDKDDIPFVQKLNLDDFFKKMEQKWNDHSPILEVDGYKFEFLAVSKADDVCTYPGLSYCMQQILGSITTRWRYMAAGSGQQQARPYQQALEAEVFPRADMTAPVQGSITNTGTALRFLGIFPASFPTLNVRESGVTQAVSGTSIFLTRNVFLSNIINHTAGGTAFTLGVLLAFSGLP
jgi:hypothetical protein